MNESVEMSSGLLDLLPDLVLTLEIEHVRHEVESILIVLYLLL